MKTTCLRCKFFTIIDLENGKCRVLVKETGDKDADCPKVTHDHSCDKWIDAGQHYHIRLGWLKNKKKAN